MMQNVFDQIKAWLKAIAELPVIAPIVAILYSRSVTFALLGLFVYGILPTNPWLAADPARLKTFGDLTIVLTLLISGRYSLEGVIDAYKQVPTGSLEELIRILIARVLEELANPTTPETAELANRVVVSRDRTLSQMGGGGQDTANTYIPGRTGVAG